MISVKEQIKHIKGSILYKEALDAVEGRIVRGKTMIQESQNFLDDVEEYLVKEEGRRFHWSPENHDHYFDMAHKYGRVMINGEWVPFDHIPYQHLIMGRLFGWMCSEQNPNGYGWFTDKNGQMVFTPVRRYRYVYIQMGKTSGKTPLSSFLHTYKMAFTKEPYNGIVLGGSTDQGKLIVDGCTRNFMNIDGAGEFKQITSAGQNQFRYYHGDLKLVYLNSEFQDRILEIATPGKNQGFHYSDISIEELHEHTTNTRQALIEAFKNHPQPICFDTTNAGEGKYGICYDVYLNSLEHVRDRHKHTAVMPMIYECDEGDDPLNDPEVRAKANPAIGVTTPQSTIDDAIKMATSPSDKQRVCRLHFSMWQDEWEEDIDSQKWQECFIDKLPEEVFEGKNTVACITWADRQNQSAIALSTNLKGISYLEAVLYWNKAAANHLKWEHQRDLKNWIKNGHLKLSEKSYSNDANDASKWLIANLDRIKAITANMDEWLMFSGLLRINGANITEKNSEIKVNGIPVYLYSKGKSEASNIKLRSYDGVHTFEGAINNGSLKILNNDVLKWNMKNVGRDYDKYQNKLYIAKDGCIDGITAITMALALEKFIGNNEVMTDWSTFFNISKEAFKEARQEIIQETI